MRNIEEIIVNRALICVLDKDNDSFITSGEPLELSEEVYEYMEKHILRALKDEEAKPAKFSGERNIVSQLCFEMLEDENAFVENCEKLAHILFKCMKNDEKEPSGNLIACMFESQQDKHIALLKMNYVPTYCQLVKEKDGKPEINIGMIRTGLPGMNQKVSRAAFIQKPKGNRDFELFIVDKNPEGYFMQGFLNCGFERDSRENTKIIQRASESFVRKAFKDNANEAEDFRNRIGDMLKNEARFSVEKTAEDCLKDEEVRQEYKAALLNEGISESEVEIDREWAEKKLKRKRLKVDKSIELYIDSDVYNDKERFQIKRNGDGTIDIILKNIRNYIER